MTTLSPFSSYTAHKHGIIITVESDELYAEVLCPMVNWCGESFKQCDYLNSGNYFYFAKESDRNWFKIRWT